MNFEQNTTIQLQKIKMRKKLWFQEKWSEVDVRISPPPIGIWSHQTNYSLHSFKSRFCFCFSFDSYHNFTLHNDQSPNKLHCICHCKHPLGSTISVFLFYSLFCPFTGSIYYFSFLYVWVNLSFLFIYSFRSTQ